MRKYFNSFYTSFPKLKILAKMPFDSAISKFGCYIVLNNYVADYGESCA
ncbi:hypothetical protein NIES2109_45320 [Nostoc sp. HK-01]|nr:hypothetical protein NIES2109_45320 [Nostoc sp. HK-01]